MSTLAPENLKKLEVPILKGSSNPSLWNFTESFVQVTLIFNGFRYAFYQDCY
jgi:hypothetical protein